MTNREFDDLGKNIEELIERAVKTQDYQQLSQKIAKSIGSTIGFTIGSAIDAGSDGIRAALHGISEIQNMQNHSSQPMQSGTEVQAASKISEKDLYKSMMGSKVKGILEIACGAVITLSMGGGLIATSVIGSLSNGGWGIGSFLMGLGVCAGIGLTGVGTRLVAKADRFVQYVKGMGGKTYCEIDKLARKIGKTPKYVLKDLKKMIQKGWFLQGHIDESETCLITSEEMFEQYMQTQRDRAEELERQKPTISITEDYSREVQEVLDKGNAFLIKIRKSNDAIPGEEISRKISRMELLVQKIFERAKEHPEIIPDLKKMMNYYLPMTVKLLDAYEDMDRQEIQGENIQNSKKEIESTIDTLNIAFEKLLDSVFKEKVLDISSDITVLQTLLAQEGLAEDELQKARKAEEQLQMPSV